MSFESPEAVAYELRVTTDNNAALDRQMRMSILKNLATHKARGDYTRVGAIKAFMYLAEAGAKAYARDFGNAKDWYKMFDVATRMKVATDWAKDFEVEYKLGNYDSLLPKKYQGAEAKAREKAQAKRIAASQTHDARLDLQQSLKSKAQLDREIAAALARKR